MRKREALDRHFAAIQSQLFFRIGNCCRILSGKRIEWLKRTTVQQDTERLRILREAVKNQTQVPFGFGNSPVDDFCTLGSVVRIRPQSTDRAFATEPTCLWRQAGSTSGIPAKSCGNCTAHSFRSATSSRSQTAAEVLPSFRDTTVNRRHCEKLALFKPSPNLPRSGSSRVARGLRLPGRMAAMSSSSVMPSPSSTIAIRGSSKMSSVMISNLPVHQL